MTEVFVIVFWVLEMIVEYAKDKEEKKYE